MIVTLTRVAAPLAFSVTFILYAAGRVDTVRAANLPIEVQDALERNAEAVTPLDLQWTTQRGSPLPLPALLKLLEQPKAFKLLTAQEFRLSVQDGKFYYFDQWKGGKKWELRELAYDNKCYYHSLGTSMHILNERILGSRRTDQAFIIYYLNGAGIFLPNTYPTFGQPPKSLVLHLLEDGGVLEHVGIETDRGIPCLRIDITQKDRSYRFFLDPKLNYAVRRQELWSGSERISSTVCEQFQPLKPPLHLPRFCRIDYFVYLKHSLPDKNRPIITETMSVTKMDQSPLPDARFVITPEVGMLVSDSRLPEAREFDSGFASYVKPANPADMQQAIDKFSAELREAQASQKRAGWQLYSVTTAVALGIVVIIVGVGYLGFRWRAARG